MLNKEALLLQLGWSCSFYWLYDNLSKTCGDNNRGAYSVYCIAQLLLSATILPGNVFIVKNTGGWGPSGIFLVASFWLQWKDYEQVAAHHLNWHTETDIWAHPQAEDTARLRAPLCYCHLYRPC